MTNQPTTKQYSTGEEIFNSVSHGVGALLSVIGASILVTLAVCFGNGIAVVSSIIYGVSLTMLYTMSTLYHAFPFQKVKRLFRIFDHSSVYLLIAGTYTPFTLITLQHSAKGFPIFIAMWVCTAIGILLNVFNVEKFKWVSLVLYVGMGWTAIFAIKDIAAALPKNGFILLLAGGIAYTVGIVFYVMKKVKYMHAVWHLFVLLGSILHYFCIVVYVLPTTF